MRLSKNLIFLFWANSIMAMNVDEVKIMRPSTPPPPIHRSPPTIMSIDLELAETMRSPSRLTRSRYTSTPHHRNLPGNRNEQIAYIYWQATFVPALNKLSVEYIQLQQKISTGNIAGFFSSLSAIKKRTNQLIKAYRRTRKRFEQKPEVINIITDQLRNNIGECVRAISADITAFLSTPALIEITRREGKPWLEPLSNLYEYLLNMPLDD